MKEKRTSRNSGRSKSAANPFGKRRLGEGKELAPRSLRERHRFLGECSADELYHKAQVIEFHQFQARKQDELTKKGVI